MLMVHYIVLFFFIHVVIHTCIVLCTFSVNFSLSFCSLLPVPFFLSLQCMILHSCCLINQLLWPVVLPCPAQLRTPSHHPTCHNIVQTGTHHAPPEHSDAHLTHLKTKHPLQVKKSSLRQRTVQVQLVAKLVAEVSFAACIGFYNDHTCIYMFGGF